MANVNKTAKKSSAMTGLKMVGGAAAGAAAGSLVGPLGAAVGAVVGGIAGANVDEISASKPARKLASATKNGVNKVLAKKGIRKALASNPVTGAPTRKAPAKSHAPKRKVKSQKSK